MKKIFIFLQLFLFSFLLNANNESNFNTFEKFSERFGYVENPSFGLIMKNDTEFFPKLNVGNYLVFSPDQFAGIGYMEFYSDVLQKDFYTYEKTKKGKIKNKSQVHKYDADNFYNSYQKNVKSDRVEAKQMGMVLAEIKKINTDEYKVVGYLRKNAFITLIPLNSTVFLKKISDNKIIWDTNDKYSNPDYTFSLENKNLIIRNKKNELYAKVYRDKNSLFIELYQKKPVKYEFRVNEQTTQLESYKNDKLQNSVYYQTID